MKKDRKNYMKPDVSIIHSEFTVCLCASFDPNGANGVNDVIFGAKRRNALWDDEYDDYDYSVEENQVKDIELW